MFDAQRIAHIKGLQREGEAEALYKIALLAPHGKPMVELGTFQGYTTAVLALAAEQIGATVTTIDNYQPMAKVPAHIGADGVRRNLAAAKLTATVIEGDSRIVPAEITEVGLLYVDSMHTYEHFAAEMAAWLPLIIVGGIVSGHDYGGACTPQLKPIVDKTFADRHTWQQVGAFYTTFAFKRLSPHMDTKVK